MKGEQGNREIISFSDGQIFHLEVPLGKTFKLFETQLGLLKFKNENNSTYFKMF